MHWLRNFWKVIGPTVNEWYCQPNLKITYMRVFHFYGNQHGRVLILKTWPKGFLNERECYLLEFRCNCVHFQVKFSPYPSGFGCIIYCLARENGQWVIKTPQPHSQIKLAALRAKTRTYICINCQILTGENQNIWMVSSCVFTSVVFCLNMAERFPEWAWMPFTWIPSQCPHFAGESQLIKMASSSIKGQAPPSSDI